MSKALADRPPHSQLSPREVEVLELIAKASATRRSAARWASPRPRSNGTSTSFSSARRRRSHRGHRRGPAAWHHPPAVTAVDAWPSLASRRGSPAAARSLSLRRGRRPPKPPARRARHAPGFYSRRVWQSSDGLPEDFAQALAQTPDGYLWIGTSGGLVRFDGVRFAVFNAANEPAFRDDSVYVLLTRARRHAVGGHRGRRARSLSPGPVPRLRHGRGTDQPLRARRVRRSTMADCGSAPTPACFDWKATRCAASTAATACRR